MSSVLAFAAAFLMSLICSPYPTQAADPGLYDLHHIDRAYAMAPTEADLRVSDDEDLACLDAVLDRILPDGTDGLSPEKKAVEILRYASTSLLLKNNGGSATKIIKEGYGICGAISTVFRTLCRRAGLPARYIGAFYLRPGQGGHAISEVHYDNAWHLLDPTFGLFYYSREIYDGSGAIPSFHDLVLAPSSYHPLKVCEKPWLGRYDDPVRAYGVTSADSDFLKDVYGTGIVDLYRKYLTETFPVAYGGSNLISFPVDADLGVSDRLLVGTPDEDSRDVVLQALNGNAYVGGHYLGGSFPPGFHTWSVKAPVRSRLRVTYHCTTDDPPALTLVCLKAVHLASQTPSGKHTTFELTPIGPEIIFSVYCPAGTYIVDAMEIARKDSQ
jgi:transglutaminase-like putative cysteine protease